MSTMARDASLRLGVAGDAIHHCNGIFKGLSELLRVSPHKTGARELAEAGEYLASNAHHFVGLDAEKMWEAHLELREKLKKISEKHQ